MEDTSVCYTTTTSNKLRLQLSVFVGAETKPTIQIGIKIQNLLLLSLPTCLAYWNSRPRSVILMTTESPAFPHSTNHLQYSLNPPLYVTNNKDLKAGEKINCE